MPVVVIDDGRWIGKKETWPLFPKYITKIRPLDLYILGSFTCHLSISIYLLLYHNSKNIYNIFGALIFGALIFGGPVRWRMTRCIGIMVNMRRKHSRSPKIFISLQIAIS